MQDYQASGRVYTKNEDRGTRALPIGVNLRMREPSTRLTFLTSTRLFKAKITLAELWGNNQTGVSPECRIAIEFFSLKTPRFLR